MEITIRFICCILFLFAVICDERERKIPRYLSYMECICAVVCWCVSGAVNRQTVFGNLAVSAGLFGVLCLCCVRGQLGRADLYLILSMFVLLSQRQPTRELLWEENMLLVVAFMTAAIRLLIQRIRGGKNKKKGCPFALHLLLGYLFVMIG